MRGITYRNHPVELVRSDRRSLSLQVKPDGTILIRAPRRLPQYAIQAFLEEKDDWIAAHLQEAARIQHQPPFTEAELTLMKQAAAADLRIRLLNYAALLGVSYGRVSIRAQKTRWGSCSRQGNLNFNCLLMLCPPEVRDYVVVHELCHRLEMNHSPRFWENVEQVLPDYRAAQNWLKQNGSALIMRLPNCN